MTTSPSVSTGATATPDASADAADGAALAADRRAWEIVLRSVESRLLSGELKPGEHLPPERQLAADLGVGRSSVREAIRVLEVLGLIRTATGSGPTAGAIIVATPSGGMSALMRLQVAAHGFAVADVVKTRLVLEAAVVAELASSTTSPDSPTPDSPTHDPLTPDPRQFLASAPLEVAQQAVSGAARAADPLGPASQLLDAMDSTDLTEAEFLALDAQFHLALAEASGNQVVAAMMAGLRNSIESYVLAAVPNLSSWAQTSARLRVEHRGILNAIRAGDQADAAARVREHITGYYAESRLTPHAAPLAPPTAPPRPSTKARADRPRKEPTHG